MTVQMNNGDTVDLAVATRMQTDNITNETRLTRIQALVVEILNDLLRAPIDGIDDAVHAAIARIGVYCLRDRSYVFVNNNELTSNTHEWCATGIEPQIAELQDVPWELYGAIRDNLERGVPFHVPDVAELEPGSTLRELFESQQIRSMLLVPMRAEGAFYGFIGFDGVHNTHDFLPGEIYLLQSVADVICSVLQRRESERAVRRVQGELAAERAFLASILSTPAMGILAFDGGGAIRFANDAALQILRRDRKGLIGMRHDAVKELLIRNDGQPMAPGEAPFDQVRAGGSAVADTRLALHGPDDTRYVSVHAAPVPRAGENESDPRVVYALVDVTEQVEADRDREAALDEARRANAAKSQFLAKMSHEMRTPLNGVLGIAEVLEPLVRDPDQKRMVKILHDSGSLLLNIINDLLDMSKIEADRMTIEMLPFSVSEIAQRLEAVHTLKASEKQLSFAVTASGDGASRRLGDPHRLLQILHNVIGNAIKFTRAGSVHVGFDCADPERIAIEVNDTGIGMTEEQQRHVFEEFGQADSAIARKFGGTGLGMPIAKRLVEMMGGTIDFRSEVGRGTRVFIDLPLSRVAAPDAQLGTMTAPQPQIDLSGLRVLAADDNRTNRMILGAMMGQLGITAVLVPDGPSALDAWDRDSFDAVILDISMPEMDGVAVLRAIREREEAFAGAVRPGGLRPVQRPVPILAFTANAMAHQVKAYRQAGFDDCLTKPLQLERLRSALGALVPGRGRVRVPASQ